MRAVPPAKIAEILASLNEHPLAGPSTRSGLEYFQELFGNRAAAGIEMATRAMRIAMPEERVQAICLAYADALQQALREAEALSP